MNVYRQPAGAGLSTQKVAVLRQLQSLVIRAGHIRRRNDKCLLLDVPKESLSRAGKSRRVRRELIYGTNFRHAVEFSRSGRTPSRPFRGDPGQPEIHYPVGSARSNTTGTARTPTWSGRLQAVGASCLGDHPPGSARFLALRLGPFRGSVSRTSPTLANAPRAVQIAPLGNDADPQRVTSDAPP